VAKPKPTKPTSTNPSAPNVPFTFRCDVSVFPLNEIKALERHGARFEALASGTARPATPEEKHFLRVNREETEPETVAERAWLRLKARREYEREEQGTKPPAPPENYGMVEFDADRCWW
jgi:uncharacterized protein YifE (UPF0438 family)